MRLRFLSRSPAKSYALLGYLVGVCLLLQPACHGKGQGRALSQSGSCLGVPNIPAGTDLVYPVYGPDEAPGSASHPLPITRAVDLLHGQGCVDGEDALWMNSTRRLRRYDANLVVTFEVVFLPDEKAYSAEEELAEGLACDAHGAWIVLRKSSGNGWMVKVARYTKDGLAEEHTTNASDAPRGIRLGPDGPLVEFYNWPLIIDGTSYEKPADQTEIIASAVYRVFPKADLPRVVWIPGATLGSVKAGAFVVDADGSYLAAWPERNDSSLLHFRRYGADGVENASREISGQFSQVMGAATATSQGYLVLAGDGGVGVVVDPDHTPIYTRFTLVLDRDGNVVWTRGFHGEGLAVAADSVWLYGQFGEWMAIDGFAAFGQMGEIREGRYTKWGWDHRFVAVFDASGTLRHLEALGDHPDTNYAIIPADENHAFMLGSAAESESEAKQSGLTGPLPHAFLGRLDLTGRGLATMPPQPEEQLPRFSLPQDLGRITDVRSSHDGNAYVVLRKDNVLSFVDYPSGKILPPFPLTLVDWWYPAPIERIGSDLFFGIHRFRLQGGEWTEAEQLDWDRSSVEGNCPDMLVSGGWLFLTCEKSVIGWRRQGELWELATRKDGVGGSSIDADDSFLVVGNPKAEGQREQEGDAHVFPITADGLGSPVLLKPSDPLPYAPGSSAYGVDTASPPPPGKHFGRSVHVATPWVVVSDQESSYGFEHVGDTWVERWKQTPAGVLMGDKYYVIDPTEPRGLTGNSGVIHIYERDGKAWKERQRVVPSQRWRSSFGDSFVRLADRLLVAAPGYGIPDDSTAAKEGDGAVFSIPFGACPKPN